MAHDGLIAIESPARKKVTTGRDMAVKSDIEIAQAATLSPIQEIADNLGIPSEALIPYGHDKAKISADCDRGIADTRRRG
jgi:hypothetical protein